MGTLLKALNHNNLPCYRPCFFIVGTERVTLKASCPGSGFERNGMPSEINCTNYTASFEPLHLLINEAEIVLEDGLSINDVLNE